VRKRLIYGAGALATAIALTGAIALTATASTAEGASPSDVPGPQHAPALAYAHGHPVSDAIVTCPAGASHVTGDAAIDPEAPADPRTPEQILADVAKFMIPGGDRMTLALPYRGYAANGREITRQALFTRADGTHAALFAMNDVGTGTLIITNIHTCS